MKKLLLVAVGLLLATQPARAELKTYEIETPHTQIVFVVNHLGFSHSYGKFLEHKGTIQFDQANPAASKVDITIKTASLDLNDQKWNDHLKNADFFDVAKFPDMTFKSTKVDVTGKDTAKITGDLTIKGVTKSVVLDTKLNKAGKHPMSGKEGAGFSATTTIKRSDFGISYGLPAVGDEVKIALEVEAYAADAGVTAQ